MEVNTNYTALLFILMGTLLHLGRRWIARQYVKLYAWLGKKTVNERLVNGVMLYLTLMGMVFTLAGVLSLLKLIPL